MRSRTLALILMLLAAPGVGWSRPPLRVPDDASEVLERLPRGYAALMPGPATSPSDPVAEAMALIAAAARTGDSRLAHRAAALLQTIPDDDARPAVLRARAFSAQYAHDFAGALEYLGRLAALEPRDGAPRLAIAQIHLVQGNVRQARAECSALVLGADSALGLPCVAAIALRTGDYANVETLTRQWLDGAAATDGLRAYVTLMRAEAAFRAGAADADHGFAAALALDPDDVRTLAAYARFLLGSGRAAAVPALLAGTGDNDLLQLQRTLAAAATGAADAAVLAAAQARRYRIAREVGKPAELRDEAEFLLTIRHDAPAALVLAQENFRHQRDYEDVRLLQRAAAASGRPDALAPLVQWAAREGLTLAPVPP